MQNQMPAHEGSDVRDMLLIAGGVALVVLGAGCILANPSLRRALLGGTASLGSLGDLGGVLPDVERYLKLKAM